MPRAIATFVNDVYDESSADPFGRVHIERSFSGDIVGSTTAELLTSTSDDGSAAYVALDRVRAELGGRSGGFVLQHWGTVSSEGASTAGAVVPGSATGGLAGLRGEARIAVTDDGTHTLELDYELPA